MFFVISSLLMIVACFMVSRMCWINSCKIIDKSKSCKSWFDYFWHLAAMALMSGVGIAWSIMLIGYFVSML